ncbi:T6SS immunity protein Tdi1 domain-containing protein [Capnocytophaga canimorsus]|uniref:T6SS immunity protein Tdi1 domain-containing protein n=1 Tax=Capnocytophaga canimorsus TaxID=28188 RepID=UPI00385BC085
MEDIEDFIARNKDTYIKVADVSQSIIDKYSNMFQGNSYFPKEVIWLWENMGFGIYENGYLQLVNPEEWDFVFEYIDKILEPAVVIGITALGDILVWEGNDNWTIAPDEGNRMGFFNVRNLSKKIKAQVWGYLEFDADIKKGTPRQIKEFQTKPYLEMKDKLPKLEYGQCYGYVPALALGGSRSNKNLQVVDTKAYIHIIGQAVGKIYDLS